MTDSAKATQAEGLVGFLLRLRTRGLSDPALLKALESVPHNQFVPVNHYERAWKNSNLPIACGQTLHAPDITARMVAALAPQPHHSILELGTGTGFQTAVLAKLAKKVHTIERYRTLMAAARERLSRLNIANVSYIQADGSKGTSGQGLYDGIITDLAFDSLPRMLLDQLVSGGVVIAAVGPAGEEQMLMRLTKIGSRFEREDLFPVRFGTFETGVAEHL